jgi:DNA-binding Lrp family transcriptional regulator
MNCDLGERDPKSILFDMPVSKITATDELLLQLLQKNARLSNKALAQAAGIAESTCLERVRSLQERKVIRGWHADVDLRALNRTIRALIAVRLQPKTTESVHAFQSSLMNASETINVWTVSGADDFLVEVAVPDVDRLRSFVLEVITSRPDVADSRTSLVYEHRRNHELAVLEPSE